MLDISRHVTVTSAVPAVCSGESVIITVPASSVVRLVSDSDPKVVVKASCSPERGFPLKNKVTVIWEVSVVFAAIVSGEAKISSVALTMFVKVEFVNPSHVTVIVADPVIDPGDKYTLASPAASVTADEADKVPNVVEKVTCPLGTTIPPI